MNKNMRWILCSLVVFQLESATLPSGNPSDKNNFFMRTEQKAPETPQQDQKKDAPTSSSISISLPSVEVTPLDIPEEISSLPQENPTNNLSSTQENGPLAEVKAATPEQSHEENTMQKNLDISSTDTPAATLNLQTDSPEHIESVATPVPPHQKDISPEITDSTLITPSTTAGTLLLPTSLINNETNVTDNSNTTPSVEDNNQSHMPLSPDEKNKENISQNDIKNAKDIEDATNAAQEALKETIQLTSEDNHEMPLNTMNNASEAKKMTIPHSNELKKKKNKGITKSKQKQNNHNSKDIKSLHKDTKSTMHDIIEKYENEHQDEDDNKMEEHLIVVMNATDDYANLYGQTDDEEIILAHKLDTIAQIVIPSNIKTLRAESGHKTSNLLVNKDIKVLSISQHSDPDLFENKLELQSTTMKGEQTITLYNATNKDQIVKATYPDDETFFFTPHIYYAIPALSSRHIALPALNKKGNQTKVYLYLSHSKKKIIIPAIAEETICVIYEDDDVTILDDITQDFR